MYGKIGDMRRVNLIIKKQDKVVFEGSDKDLPQELKEKHYTKIELKSGKTILEIE